MTEGAQRDGRPREAAPHATADAGEARVAAGEVVLCPVCEVDAARHWGTEYKGHVIVRCGRCGLRYVSPRRDEAENLAVYDTDSYFDNLSGIADPRELEMVVRTALRSVRTILASGGRADGALLDVGTGVGFLPKMARLMGFRTVAGSDLTAVNRETLGAFGIPLIVGDVTRMPREEVLRAGGAADGFDVVSLMHVLEHVLDPNAFLQGLRGLLVPGGLLYLVLPNEGSASSVLKSLASRWRLKRRAYKHLSPGHHLFFYTRATLERLLAKNGFTVVYSGTRSAEKPRGPVGAAVHAVAHRLHTGTWLEVAARSSQ